MNEFSNTPYGLVKMKTLIYIVRHGETTLNAGNKFRGFMDVPLNENGIKDAKEVRQELLDIDLSHGYSSDLQRAKETADIICSPHHIQVEVLKDMKPWNVGKFAGQPKNEKNKKELQQYADNPDDIILGGESLNQFRNRYKKVFDYVVQQSKRSVQSGGGPSLMAQHASNCHEIGNIMYGDIEALDVDPGGVIVISVLGDKLIANIFKGATKGNKPDTVS